MCMDKTEFWEYKGILFVRAAGALARTQEALPRPLDAEEILLLKEVSNIFYAGHAWLNRLGKAPHPLLAMEAYSFLNQFASRRLSGRQAMEYWQKMVRATVTMNAAIVGQQPSAEDVAEACTLCSEISDYILALGEGKMRQESNDD